MKITSVFTRNSGKHVNNKSFQTDTDSVETFNLKTKQKLPVMNIK